MVSLLPWLLLAHSALALFLIRDGRTAVMALAVCTGPALLHRLLGGRLGRLLPALLAVLFALATGMNRHDMLAVMLAAAVASALKRPSLRLLTMAIGLMIVAGFPSLRPPYVIMATIWSIGLALWLRHRHGRLLADLGTRSSAPFWPAASLAILGLGLGGATAVALPRLERWIVDSAVFATGRRTSGFSLQSDLNGVSRIQTSMRLALRLFARGPRYLRGQVFTDYQKGRWRARRPGPFVRVHGRNEAMPEGLDERIELELPGFLSLFAPLDTKRLHAVGCRVERNRNGLYVVTEGSPGVYAYGRAKETLTSTRTGDPESYRRLPEGFSPEFFHLAHAWCDGESAPRKKVEALVRALGRRCRYSLEAGLPPEGSDPLENFLLRSRQGHCEYFASVATLQLRALSIPARYVTGYSVVERNAWGGYFVARDRDAHAWVEAWIPGEGWVTFDPTPPDWRGDAAGDGQSLQPMWEEFLYRFARWQSLWAARLSRVLASFEKRLHGSMGLLFAIGLLLIVSVLLSFFVLLLSPRLRALVREWWSRRRPKGEDRSPLGRARSQLSALEELLHGLELGRKEAETPREWLKRLRASALPDAVLQASDELLQLFCRCRYGGQPWPEERAEGVLRRLKRSLHGETVDRNVTNS